MSSRFEVTMPLIKNGYIQLDIRSPKEIIKNEKQGN